jgi:hypothetical protein
VFHEADTSGSKTVNGSWSGMVAMVINGTAEVGVSPIYVTKEKSDVVAYTDTLGFIR